MMLAILTVFAERSEPKGPNAEHSRRILGGGGDRNNHIDKQVTKVI